MSCAYWNESSLTWSTRDANTTSEQEQFIRCTYDHLTNFAALFVSGDIAFVKPKHSGFREGMAAALGGSYY